MEKKDYKTLYRDVMTEAYRFEKIGKQMLEAEGMTYTPFTQEFFKWVAFRQKPNHLYREFKDFCGWVGSRTDKTTIQEWCDFMYHKRTMNEHGSEYCPNGDALTKYFPDERL